MTDEELKAWRAQAAQLGLEHIVDGVMQEAACVRREILGLARDHLREKGGWIEINGVRFYKGNIPEEH